MPRQIATSYHLVATRGNERARAMAVYRIYFRSRAGSIQGRDEFHAEHDRQALLIAELLCEACGDICDNFELWQGARLVEMPQPSVSAAQITASMQESLIQREETIRDSQWMIARSKRLLERLQYLTSRNSGA
jgi:hypothetical protein